MRYKRIMTIDHDHFLQKVKWSWSQIIVIIFILGLLFTNSSCTSRKKVIQPIQPQAFEWMTANLGIQAEGNGMVFNDLSGQLRMRKDSIVWLSVTATMGVEVLRAKFSNDSVWVLNRMEKSYLAESFDTISFQLDMPLNLPLIQTLLLDNNEGIPPVENQTVLLKAFAFGNMSAKVRYSNIKLDEKTTFPLKITGKMKRFRIKSINEQ